jgi:tetratricopeptide (TPR) repeat protein
MNADADFKLSTRLIFASIAVIVLTGLLIVILQPQAIRCSLARNLTSIKLIQVSTHTDSSRGGNINIPANCGQWGYAALGLEDMNQGNRAESISYFQQANSLGSNIIYFKRLGDIYYLQGNKFEAINYWYQAGDYPSIMTVAEEALKLKQWELARNGYQLAIKTGRMEDREFFGHYRLGMTLLFGYKDINNAEKEYLTAIQYKPEYLEAYLALGDLWLGQKDFQKASDWYEQAINISPKNPKAYYYYASMKYGLGDYASAKELLTKSLQQDPNYEASKYLFSKVLKKIQ